MKKHDESLWQNYSETVKAAARLARKLHEGQTDKAGIDYFEGHLTAVANCGVNWMEQVWVICMMQLKTRRLRLMR